MVKARRKIITAIMLTLAYYAFLFFCRFILFDLIKLYPSDYQLGGDCIIVHGQAVTGPQIRVVEGADFLSSAIPSPLPDDLNLDEIEMTGKSIYDSFLKYPDYYRCNWLIYGRVVDTTDKYEECMSGTIPVFECDKLYPIVTLSQLLSTDTVMFAMFPLGLIFAAMVYLLPIILMAVYISSTRRKCNNLKAICPGTEKE